ncbi:MAG: hypothetical protein RIB65_11255 [Ilumatobacter fluminis]|uniref:hypothetical protein n=1 Tax=Ilumatobacter fluminis TaxID=467091 RepID=UPI0032EB52CD
MDLNHLMSKASKKVELLSASRATSPTELAERIVNRYRWVARNRALGWFVTIALLAVAVLVVSTDTVNGRSATVVWLVWLTIAQLWFLARYTALAAAPIAYFTLLSHLPPPAPRNAREDAAQRIVRFTLAVTAAASLTVFGLHREYQLSALESIDTSDNTELQSAVHAARQSVESSWWLSSAVVLGLAIVVGVGRWARTIDLTLYSAGVYPPHRQGRLQSGTQYVAAAAAFGGTLGALFAAVVA